MDNAAMSDSPADRPAYTRISRKHKGVDVEVRQQERRQKLFEAGLELLGTKGFHTTTVREVSMNRSPAWVPCSRPSTRTCTSNCWAS